MWPVFQALLAAISTINRLPEGQPPAPETCVQGATTSVWRVDASYVPELPKDTRSGGHLPYFAQKRGGSPKISRADPACIAS